jgi:redox-sensitive bicupin YhaK (pirin superfamily)
MEDIRRISTRTSGSRHGPITRVMSPGDMGEMVKPFVFLDYVDAADGPGPNFGFHPHSGIATLTFPLTFDIQHETSTGQIDVVQRGGIEWVVTGGGIWHRAKPINGTTMQAFQTWFALPESHENSQPSSKFVQPNEVPRVGPVTVLLGSFGDVASSIDAPFDANYLWIQLKDGETFNYSPPANHQVAWVFAQSGSLRVSGEALSREMAVFEESDGALRFQADGQTAFLLGSAVKRLAPLVLGPYSVHTSPSALKAGTSRIEEIGTFLRNADRSSMS